MGWKIYTKGGDKGATGLLGGNRVKKNHMRLEAYGTIDELNSWVGMIRSFPCLKEEELVLNQIQISLFDVGSWLAYDKENAKHEIKEMPLVNDQHVVSLENEIDRMNQELPDLKSFILPGGNQQSSACHIARTVCRRAERRVVALSEDVEIKPVVIRYLNRLSDYFFVLARYILKRNEIKEILWAKDV